MASIAGLWYNEGNQILYDRSDAGNILRPEMNLIGGSPMSTLPPHDQNGKPRKKLAYYNGAHPKWRSPQHVTMLVYALVDPRNGNVRYVGITDNLLRRLNEHMRLYGGNTRKNAWLQGLLDAHMLPIMRTLEVVAEYGETREREIAWIQAYVKAGADLLNDEVQ